MVYKLLARNHEKLLGSKDEAFVAVSEILKELGVLPKAIPEYKPLELEPVISVIVDLYRVRYHISRNTEIMMISALLCQFHVHSLTGHSVRPWRLNAIAQFYGMDKQTVRRSIDTMVERGFATTKMSGRTVQVFPTELTLSALSPNGLFPTYASLLKEAVEAMDKAVLDGGDK